MTVISRRRVHGVTAAAASAALFSPAYAQRLAIYCLCHDSVMRSSALVVSNTC